MILWKEIERKVMSNQIDKQIINSNYPTGNKEMNYEPGKNPNSLANLKSWKKGESGNPGGRPYKYEKLAKQLKIIGDEDVVDTWGEQKGYTYKEGVLQTIWIKALHGNMQFVNLLSSLGCFDKEDRSVGQ